jgi:hypothetical protein
MQVVAVVCARTEHLLLVAQAVAVKVMEQMEQRILVEAEAEDLVLLVLAVAV